MDNFQKNAVDLAYKAGEIMKKNFTLNMTKEWKDDNTPVTVTDNAINDLVLSTLSKKFPDMAIISEEGSMDRESEYKWVCDPIDGTFAFSHGYPTFAFSLALTKNGQSVMGVIYDPIMDRLLTAQKGKGAFLNGKKISVTEQKEINSKTFIHDDTYYRLAGMKETLAKSYDCLVPSIYSCVYASMLIAFGEFAGEVYEFNKPWDGASVKIIIEEAGGKVTDIMGNEQRYDQEINGFIASNGHIHEELVKVCKKLLKK